MTPSPSRTSPRPAASKRARPAGWTVYLVRCRDGSLYTGATNDLERRLDAHNRGKGAAYTRSRRPVELVYQEPAHDRSAALKREAALKKLDRRQKLALVERRTTRAALRRPARQKRR